MQVTDNRKWALLDRANNNLLKTNRGDIAIFRTRNKARTHKRQLKFSRYFVPALVEFGVVKTSR